MGNIISYDTEEMGLWSGNVNEAAQSFVDEVGSLYRLIDEFVADDFATNGRFYAIRNGNISYGDSSSDDLGIRPVITISKSELE